MITAVVIPADDDQPMREVQYDAGNIDFMKEIIGGWFDAVDGKDHGLTFWIHDEGKIIGLPLNRRATLALWSADFRWFEADALMGDVLVTGLPDGAGETQSVPDEFIQLLFHTKAYKPEVMAGSDKNYASNSLRFNDWLECINYTAGLAHRWLSVKKFRVSAA